MQNYPDEEVPDFHAATTQLFKEVTKVGLKIIEVMGYALKLKVCMQISIRHIAELHFFSSGSSFFLEKAH